MYISKLVIENYKCFKGKFSLDLNKHLNIIVGDNEVGKSTIIEAINLALTGLLNGKYLKFEFNQYLFNNEVRDEYINSINEHNATNIPTPPEITIEIFIDGIDNDSLRALYEGNGNSEKKKACGLLFKIALSEANKTFYEELIKTEDIKSIPIEYYDFHWATFARDETVIPSLIPIKPALIDSSSTRYQNGSDVYISRILHDYIDDSERIAISQAHRKFTDYFNNDKSIETINQKIQKAIGISDKKVNLSVDVSSKNAWETTLTTYLDNVPFHYVGKGEQTLIKTKLALSHKKAMEANVLLVEEPENHLSYTKLNKLVDFIKNSNIDKQIIVSTHSSFVANKLGLGNLILFGVEQVSNHRTSMPFTHLTDDTKEYFEKLAGYDTLRLILCKSAILVEGDSDELIVSKAYMSSHNSKLPIEQEREVISVGTAFLRFLEIAEKVKKHVAAVTDNDGELDALLNKYKDYIGSNKKQNILICYDNDEDKGKLAIGKQKRLFNYNTLEPKLVKENGLQKMNKILNENYTTEDELHKYMLLNKTECALRIFKTTESVIFPKYILQAVNFTSDENQ